MRVRAAGGAEEARVPFHADFAAELLGVERAENFPRFRFERRITAEDDERNGRRKNKVELLGARLVVRPQGAVAPATVYCDRRFQIAAP